MLSFLVRRAELAFLTVCVVALGTLAAWHKGLPTMEMDMHDGGVWVTNASTQQVGHLNYPSRTLDGAVVAANAKFDVTQNAKDVLVTTSTYDSGQMLDVANYVLSNTVAFGKGVAAHGGKTIAISDPHEGKVWASPFDSVAGFNPEADANLEELPGARTVVDVDGGVHVVANGGKIRQLAAPEKGTAVTAEATWDGLAETSKLALTTVGDTLVVHDQTSNTIRFGEQKVTIPTEGPVALQKPGPASPEVLLTTDDSLVRINLKDGQVNTTPAGGKGKPVAPVRLGDCLYAVWEKSGQYVRDCATDSDDVNLRYDELAAAQKLTFRTNRDVIVLNDVNNGNVFLVNHEMQLVNDWKTASQSLSEDEKEEEQVGEAAEGEEPERTEKNRPPVAQDDTFGVRPGRSTVIPVLTNDSDPDGDILTVTAQGELPFGTIAPARAGRALQVVVPKDGTGSGSFEYTVDDGRGGTDKAKVTVNVKPLDVNEGPKQVRKASVRLAAGAEATYNVLADWMDPDGDAIYLQNGFIQSGLDVKTQADGTVVIKDLQTDGPGRKEIEIVMSDGTDTTTGFLYVQLLSKENLKPVAMADSVRVVVGQEASVAPVRNDLDANGDELRLSNVRDVPPQLEVQSDYANGIVTVKAKEAGTFYINYTVSDGPSVADGWIRVDAVVPKEEGAPPIAESDLVLLPSGGSQIVDVLANDFDPQDGVLVLQGIAMPPNSPLVVQIINHHVLRITAPSGLTDQARFEYMVANGSGVAKGQVTVLPVTAVSASEPPVALDDSTRVRAGDIVSIPVLKNDSSPGGGKITVDPKLQTMFTPEEGQAFVSENIVRFKAGSKAGTYRLGYTIRDPRGNVASAQVEILVTEIDEKTNQEPKPRPVQGRAIAGAKIRIPIVLDGIDPDGDSVQLVGLSKSPTLGTATLGPTWIDYEATKSSGGTDVFAYEVQDRFGAKATAEVRVGVAPPAETNQAPIAVTDPVIVRTKRNIAVSVLANDFDPDGDKIALKGGSVEHVDGKQDESLSTEGGRVRFNSGPDAKVFSLYYQITDGRGGIGKGIVNVDVRENAPLLPPIGRDDVLSQQDIIEKEVVEVDILANDEDPDGTIDDVKVSVDGEAQWSGNRLIVPVKPERQVLVYTLTDQDGLKGSAAVVVPGAGTKEDPTPPILRTEGLPLKVTAGEELRISLAQRVVVREGRKARITTEDSVKVVAGSSGNQLVADPYTLSFVPNEDFEGRTSISFEVTDGTDLDDATGVKATLSIPIIVEGVKNTPPTITPAEVRVAAGEEATTVDLATMTTDPDEKDEGKLVYSMGAVSDKIKASLQGSTLSVSADVDVPEGTVGTIAVTVKDTKNPEVSATVPVTVTASTRPLMVATLGLIDDAHAGKAVDIDLTKYVTNPFADKNLPISMVGAPTVESGKGTVQGSGTKITVTPDAEFFGELVVRYKMEDATKAASRNVEGRIRITVKGKPAPPTNVSGETRRSKSATIRWTSGDNRGAPITNFTVIWDGGTKDCGTATVCSIETLTNNVEYTFTVTATNDVGTSEPSAPSASIRPDVKPDQPAAPKAEFGDKQAKITWTTPTTEGSPVTGFTVEVSGPAAGASQKKVTGNSLVWPGLTNGAEYRFRVQAHSSATEPSDWSPYSTPVIPAGVPLNLQPPTVKKDPAGNLAPSATITWAAPNGNGDNNMTYVVTRSDGKVVYTGTNRSTRVELPVGKDQTFSFTAKNKAGVSKPSGASNVVRGFLTPAPVTGVRAEAPGETGVLNVRFNAADGRGATVAEMTYHWSGGGRSGKIAGNQTSFKATGLANGTGTVIQVWAVSQVRGETASGPKISSNSATPYGPPTSPRMSCSNDFTTIRCTWNGGNDNGRRTVYRLSDAASGDVGASGSRNFDAGFSATRRLCVQAIQDGGHKGRTECASASTRHKPTNQAAWLVSGRACDVKGIGGTDECRHMLVRLRDWIPNRPITCWINGVGNPGHRESTTIDSNGNSDFTMEGGYINKTWAAKNPGWGGSCQQ